LHTLICANCFRHILAPPSRTWCGCFARLPCPTVVLPAVVLQDGVVFKGNVRSKDPRAAYAKLKQRLQVRHATHWYYCMLCHILLGCCDASSFTMGHPWQGLRHMNSSGFTCCSHVTGHGCDAAPSQSKLQNPQHHMCTALHKTISTADSNTCSLFCHLPRPAGGHG
jgi:hypothetical protein